MAGLTGANPRTLLTLASTAVALAAADTYVVVLALTDMMSGVGLGLDNLQRAAPIISGFLLGYIAVLPLIGRLADLVPRSRILLGCLVVFVIGSGITALAVDLDVLVAGRVVQGVGGGGLVPATLALVADLWPPGRRGMPLGVVGAVQELGSVLGPLLGAAVLVVADWRAIFWLNVVLGVLLWVAIAVATRPFETAADGLLRDRGETAADGLLRDRGDSGEGRPLRPRLVTTVLGVVTVGLLWLTLAAPAALATDVYLGLPFVPVVGTSRLLTPIGLVTLGLALALVVLTARRWWPPLRESDLPGALLLGTTLGCVVLTFSSADPETEVVGPLGYALLPVAVVTALAYVWRHRTAASPLVPRGTVRGRTGWALLVSLLVGVALVAVVVDVPLFSRLTTSGSQTDAAMELVKFLVAVPVGALLGGWVLRWVGDGLSAGIGLLLAASGLLVMSGWDRGSLAEVSSTITLALVGLGLGMALAPVNDAALADAPQHAHGTASSLVVVARMVGMVVGLALLTGIGLHRYYEAVDALPREQQTSGQALLDAALLQVHTVFVGAAGAAFVGALLALACLGIRRREGSGSLARGLGVEE
ncbi:major facilitator superfamily protein [Janibacter hoylei PVAS-1]|uniref:Major facilitator superfamily protein n=1 Tax=Janibacter hoylei PVAS-1 TaxID=1210046 RepID=K1E5I5_9MICO|nr:MFS transporter [Janibacter hoylei]EKA62306.1 major facilitator superfamily protein [Janibacter hoylei PVAS-1]